MDGDGSQDDSEEEGKDDMGQAGVLNVVTCEDPRTISQIKRSRIDLAKRYVFLCPTSLCKHFDALPHRVKDAALLVFRCRRNWLIQDLGQGPRGCVKSRVNCGSPLRGKRAASASSPSRGAVLAHQHSDFPHEFTEWVRAKEHAGCVFWFRPDRGLERLSQFLEASVNPVNEQPYRPLLLDQWWWRTRFSRATARFVAHPGTVIAAIRQSMESQSTAIDIPTLQELIYQSNPTLEPVSKWPHAPSMRFLPRANASNQDFVAQDSNFSAYLGTLLDGAKDQSRISRWPSVGRRLDNLHLSWQREDATSERRQMLALHGHTVLGGQPRAAAAAGQAVMSEQRACLSAR